MFFASSAFAGASFGGGELAMSGEFDGNEDAPAEFLVDLDLYPFQIQKESLSMTWAPVTVSWGVAPQVAPLDRLGVSVVYGYKAFSSGKASASFKLGELLFDQDAATMDVTFGSGGVRVGMLDQRLLLDLGADVRMRFVSLENLFNDDESEWALLLGVPVALSYHHEHLAGPLYATASLGVRPGVGLVGDTPFMVDGKLTAEGGVLLLEESEATMRVFLRYSGGLDTFNALPNAGLVNRIGLGATIWL